MMPSPASIMSPYGAPSSSGRSERRESDESSTSGQQKASEPENASHHDGDENHRPAIEQGSLPPTHNEVAAMAAQASNGESSQSAVAQQAPPAAYMRTSRISCDPCRRRKLRCDRVMPCSTCVRRGIQDRCYKMPQSTESAQARTDATHTAPASLSARSPFSNGLSAAAAAKKANHRPSPGSSTKRARVNEGGPPADHSQSRRSSRASLVASIGAGKADAPSPHTREEELESMLNKYRQELLMLSTTARDSSRALEMAMRALNAQQQQAPPPQQQQQQPSPAVIAAPAPPRGPHALIPGTGPNGLYVWRDLAPTLPSLDKCEALLSFFFDQLSIYFRINQRSAVEGMWERLHNGEGIGENAVRIICTMLAMSSGTAPANSSVPKFTPNEHFRWVSLMGSPLVSRFGEPVDNTYERILAIALLSVYFLFTGNNDRLWECLGAGIRRGYAHGLYDERSRSWDNTTPLEKEYRRRLAWYMVSLERWQAFMRQLPYMLHPDYLYLAEPMFEPDEVVARLGHTDAPIVPTFPMTLNDGRLQTHISANSRRVVKFVFIELVAVCHEYLRKYSTLTPQQRYSRAAQIDELLENKLVEGLTDTGIEHHQDLHFLRYLTCATLDSTPKERHLEVNLWVSSIFFLRCIITRRFLTDDQAPQNLRFIGLTYAQGILSTIPMLTRLVKEGRIPLQMTWNANHLLCAATTFAVVILGHDPYQGIDDGAQGRAQGGLSSNSRINKNLFPQEQVQWLADNIFTTLECLGTLVARGNNTASVAKRILERLCGSQSELQTLYRKRFNTVADGGDTCITPTMLTKTVRDPNANDAAHRVGEMASSSGGQKGYLHSSPAPSHLSGTMLPSFHAQPTGHIKGGTPQQYAQPASSMSQFLASSPSGGNSGSSTRYDARPQLPPLGKYAGQLMQTGYGSSPGSRNSAMSPSSTSARGSTGYGNNGSSTSISGASDQGMPYDTSFAHAYTGLSHIQSLHPTAMPGSLASAHASQASAPRTINASSLLDAVLMEPVDLDFLGECNTSDLLASLLQQDSSVMVSVGGMA